MHSFEINPSAEKEELYLQLLPQLRGLLQGESDLIANLANICAVLKDSFKWWWVGFYFVKGDELVLGPFQGPLACTRIAKGKGVCGNSWLSGKSIIVPDVDKYPGHIACSSFSKSEIVIPIFDSRKEIVAVLDADSEHLNHFDATDEKYLVELVGLINF